MLRDARLGGATGFADAVYAARGRLSHRLWDLVTAALLLDDRQGGGSEPVVRRAGTRGAT